MALINCPKCNETISSRAAVCPYCGFSLDEMRTCPECGSLILEKAEACPECGYPLEDEDANIRGTVSDAPLPLDTAVSESGSADLSQSASESIGAPADKNSASTTARPGVIKRMLSKIDNTVSIIGGIILICILLGAMGLGGFETVYRGFYNLNERGEWMPYVEDIKNETPAFYDITYEDAFKNFFSWPRWSSFKADDGTWVVEFSGKCQYDDKTAKAVIQFLPEEANHGTFAVYVITINDSAEDTITAYAILNTIFETAEADGIQSASSSASKSSGFGSSASPVTETLSDYEEITVIGTIESDSNGYPYLFFEQPVQYIVDGQNYGVYDSIFLFLAENSSSNYRNGDVVTVRGRIFDYRGGGTLYLDNATIQ